MIRDKSVDTSPVVRSWPLTPTFYIDRKYIVEKNRKVNYMEIHQSLSYTE